MKKLLLVFTALFLMSGFAAAQDDFTEHLYGKGQASWAVASESDFENGWATLFGVGYDFNDYIALEIESGFVTFDVENVVLNRGTGKIETVPLLFNIVAGYPWEQYKPYATIGIGYAFNDFNSNTTGLKADPKNSILGKFGVGIDYYYADNVAIFFEGSYLLNAGDTTFKLDGNSKDYSNLSTWLIGGGIKLRF
ncbi:MAG: outer membrane beta-barrel protein [Candidatus Aureabacteria bacterium]|nr:outer membrane beta-barrel protein [Candidatus Auribacterota bacterium]